MIAPRALGLCVVGLAGCAAAPRATPHDPVAANEACAGCHAEIAREWRQSLHRASYDDPIFRAAYAREPARFCASCHAPEDPRGTGAARLTSLGTACTTCHAEPHGPRKADATCGGCHEFAFPGREGTGRLEDAMQRTRTEHARSPMSRVACTGCHMPAAGGHKSHAFGGGRDPAWLASALDVRAARDAGSVTLTIGPGVVGHAVPTGDLFRRLVVGVETVDASGAVASKDERALGRRFAVALDRRVEVSNERPGANGPISVTLRAGDGRARWFVRYQRVLAERDGVAEVVEDLRVRDGWID